MQTNCLQVQVPQDEEQVVSHLEKWFPLREGSSSQSLTEERQSMHLESKKILGPQEAW
jgi:hypothetical protein